MTVLVYCDPASTSDAGRVLAAIRRARGIPAWEIARNTKLPLTRVRSALPYLHARHKISRLRKEHAGPRPGERKAYVCWYAGASLPWQRVVPSTRCTAPMGFGRECGALMTDRIDRLGRVTWTCPACERRNRGQCRSCPAPLPTKAPRGTAPWFCAACEATRRRARAQRKAVRPDERARKAARDHERNARQRRGVA